MRHACMVVAAVAATLATACKKDAAGPVGPLNGHWQGAGSGFTMDYTLKDDDSGLSGGGTVYGPAISGGTITFDAVGNRVNSSFTLRLTAPSKLAVDETGTLVNDTTTNITLNGSGFVNYTMALYRKN